MNWGLHSEWLPVWVVAALFGGVLVGVLLGNPDVDMEKLTETLIWGTVFALLMVGTGIAIALIRAEKAGVKRPMRLEIVHYAEAR